MSHDERPDDHYAAEAAVAGAVAGIVALDSESAAARAGELAAVAVLAFRGKMAEGRAEETTYGGAVEVASGR